MDGDGHILTVADLKGDGIRHGLALSRHRHAGLAVEGQTHCRGLVDLAAAARCLGVCQFHSLDLCGARAKLVGQFQAHLFAAYRNLHNLA